MFVSVNLDFIYVLFHNVVFRRRGQSVVHFNDNDMQVYSTGILRAARRRRREGDRKEQRSQKPDTGKTARSENAWMLFGHFWDYEATMARALPKNVPAAIPLAHYPKFKGVDHRATVARMRL